MGDDGAGELQDGYRFNPSTNTWTTISTAGAPLVGQLGKTNISGAHEIPCAVQNSRDFASWRSLVSRECCVRDRDEYPVAAQEPDRSDDFFAVLTRRHSQDAFEPRSVVIALLGQRVARVQRPGDADGSDLELGPRSDQEPRAIALGLVNSPDDRHVRAFLYDVDSIRGNERKSRRRLAGQGRRRALGGAFASWQRRTHGVDDASN